MRTFPHMRSKLALASGCLTLLAAPRFVGATELRRLPPEPTPVSVKGPKKSPAPTASKTLFKNGTPELDHSLEYYQQANHLPDFFGLLRKKDNWLDETGKHEQSNTVSRFLLGSAVPACILDVPVTVTLLKNVKKLKHRPDGSPPSFPSHLDDSNGFVVARIINASNCTTTPLSLDPGTYYWIVRQKPDKSGYESIFVSDVDGQTVQTTRFTRCSHINSAQHLQDLTDSFAKGVVCNNELVNIVAPILGGSEAYHRSEAIKRSLRGGVSINSVFTAADFTLWFTCELGCCYADQFVVSAKSTPKRATKPTA